MKLLVVIFVAACMMESSVKAKPIFSLKVVEVPVPKVNLLGTVSKVLGIKAALIGQTLKAKANILHKIANFKGGLGALLTSSIPQEPVHVTAVQPVENDVVVNKPSLSLSPSHIYGAPPPPVEASHTYGAPYPA